MPDLESIYQHTLRLCAPEVLMGAWRDAALPRCVVAIGKCAGPMLDGLSAFEEAIAVVPRGYPAPRNPAVELLRGGHPRMDAASFLAGERLLRFVDAHRDLLFLISGGGSACAEAPLEPWIAAEELIAVNDRLVASGLPIAQINCVRRHLSAIKGGRLGARVRGRSVSLIYSDVGRGRLADVASGPTLSDTSTTADAAAILERLGGFQRIVTALRDGSIPETAHPGGEVSLIADNYTLVATAAEQAAQSGFRAVRLDQSIESDVEEAASHLARAAHALRSGEILIAGGEPTVPVRGEGRGGRCSELAVRFAMECEGRREAFSALFGSSDGLDGNSGASAILLPSLSLSLDRGWLTDALRRSDSFTAASALGRPIIMPPTGNNLRDLYLVARR